MPFQRSAGQDDTPDRIIGRGAGRVSPLVGVPAPDINRTATAEGTPRLPVLLPGGGPVGAREVGVRTGEAPVIRGFNAVYAPARSHALQPARRRLQGSATGAARQGAGDGL